MSRKLFIHALILVLGILLLSLTACGSSTPATPQPSAGLNVDACMLLTKIDAEQILAKPVDAPTHPVQGTTTYYVDSCEYRVTGGTPRDKATLTLIVAADGDPSTAQKSFNLSKQMAQATYDLAPLDVPGLGDTAFWIGGSGRTLSVMKGVATFTLSASTQQGDAPGRDLIDLAKAVLGRLE